MSGALTILLAILAATVVIDIFMALREQDRIDEAEEAAIREWLRRIIDED